MIIFFLSPEEMFEFPPSIDASLWPDRNAAAYNEQVQEALVHRRIEADDEELLAALVGAMHFDTRKDGFGGLVLRHVFCFFLFKNLFAMRPWVPP